MGDGARDLLYGRRGGGWLPAGHDPTAPKTPTATPAVDAGEEARRAAARAALAAYALAVDVVPGTARMDGGRPAGGMTWEGAARMAAARRHAGLPLSDRDRTALDRYPTPPGFADLPPAPAPFAELVAAAETRAQAARTARRGTPPAYPGTVTADG